MTRIHIRPPRAGDLLGVSVKDLLDMEMGALITVLPRITTPRLRPAQVEQAEPCTLIALGVQLANLLIDSLQAAQRAMADDSLRLPPAVEDAMADVATVFHWSRCELSALSLAELITWHARARARATAPEMD